MQILFFFVFRYSKQPSNSSPPRPSTLPISEPKPVPSSRKISRLQSPPKVSFSSARSGDAIVMKYFSQSSATASSGIPRSQPINMKQSNRRNSNCNCDINSISPPSVQFAIGTPPSNSAGNRRRSTSGCGPETPPVPPCTWQISPSATTNFHQSPSALRRSGTVGGSPSLPSSALAKLPALSSPTLLENNNNPSIGTRAFTLPDMGAAGANGFSLLHNDSKSALEDHPITFFAPELPAETLLDVRRNLKAILNWFHLILKCILAWTQWNVGEAQLCPCTHRLHSWSCRSSLRSIVGFDVGQWVTNSSKSHTTTRARALQASRAADSSDPRSSAAVEWHESCYTASSVWKFEAVEHGKEWWVEQWRTRWHFFYWLRFDFTVLATMNLKYRSTLNESKKLNASGLLQKATANHITADKILYDHAIQMVSLADRLIQLDLIGFVFSVRRQLLMSSLATPKSASIDINRHRSCSIHWLKSARIRTIKCCWLNVSFHSTQRPVDGLLMRLVLQIKMRWRNGFTSCRSRATSTRRTPKSRRGVDAINR